MQYNNPPRRRSSVGWVIALVLFFGVLVFGALMLLGVGLLVATRSQVAESHARVQRDLARAHQQMARNHVTRESARVQVKAEVDPARLLIRSKAEEPSKPPIRVSNREITVKLDHNGRIEADGKEVELAKLKTFLKIASKGRESELEIVVKADKRCLFEHVAAVLSACQELGIPDLRITALE